MQPESLNTESLLPSISVAVCVRNGAAIIRDCLMSLMEIDYPRSKLEFIVVDNASDDETARIVEDFPVKLVKESNIGRGWARNAAIAHATGDLIAFTDADCRVENNWLRMLEPAFDDLEVGAAGGPIITPGNSHLAKFYELRKIVSNEEFSGSYPFSPPFLATANALFRTELLKRIHGFRTYYIVAEDADVCWRIQDQGYKIKYLPTGIVRHFHRTDASKLFRHSFFYGFDGVHVYLIHRHRFPKKRWIWWGLYYRLAISVLHMPFALIKRKPFDRCLPFLDFIRYSGLALGRIYAAIKFGALVL